MKKTAVGIDIGRSRTKVVFVEQKETPVLRSAFSFETPFAEDKSIDSGRFFEHIYNEIGAEVLPSASVGISIKQDPLIVIPITLPVMSGRELETAAQLEAKRRMIAQPAEKSVFRYVRGGKTKGPKGERIEVTVIRADRDSVESILNIFQDRGITPSLIAPPASLLSNLLEKQELPSGDVAFVDIGSGAMNVSIYKENRFVFFRNIAYGLDEIIASLASSLGVPQERARQVVEEVDIADIKGSEPALTGKEPAINPYALKILWQHNIERIIQELRRTLIYYKEASSGRRVAVFLFIGGGAQVKNIMSFAMSQIGGSSKVVEPFLGLGSGEGVSRRAEETPIFANAAALALQALKLSPSIPNFLPPDIQKKYLYVKRQLVIKYALMLITAAAFFFSLRLFYDIRRLARRAESLSQKLENLSPVVRRNEQIKQRLKQTYSKITQIKSIVAASPDFYRLLSRLPQAVPDRVVLLNLSLKPQAEAETKTSPAPRPAFSRLPRFSRRTTSGQIYYLQGEGEFFGTYEELKNIAGTLRDNLKNICGLEEVEVELPLLEKMIPYASCGSEGAPLSFSQPQKRTFKFKARLKKKK